MRALGLQLGDLVQVSTNIEDHTRVTAADVVAAVSRHAQVRGAELVGLAPAAALEGLDVPLRNRRTLEDHTRLLAVAQTKRKRRSKHRGTAAGTIETRGRTGRKPERRRSRRRRRAKDRRQQRLAQPPTWQRATLRAAAAAGLLFVLTQVGLFQQDVAARSGDRGVPVRDADLHPDRLRVRQLDVQALQQDAPKQR